MGIFKKNRPDDGVIVLSKPAPMTCGGTDATLDTRAPKSIASREMVLFSATSVLPQSAPFVDVGGFPKKQLGYVSAFASPAGDGVFLFLEIGYGFRFRDGRQTFWALIKEDLFPALVDLVNSFDLAKDNGYHARTHGLPENFGGEVDIRYASGETISFSNNQSPVLTGDAGAAIAARFQQAMRGERLPLPDLAALRQIRFAESRADGGYTKAALSLLPDGSGVCKRSRKFDTPKVYESEQPLDCESVAQIKKRIADCGILAWADLPENKFFAGENKSLTFVFADGEEITVSGGKACPAQIGVGFFDIETKLS